MKFTAIAGIVIVGSLMTGCANLPTQGVGVSGGSDVVVGSQTNAAAIAQDINSPPTMLNGAIGSATKQKAIIKQSNTVKGGSGDVTVGTQTNAAAIAQQSDAYWAKQKAAIYQRNRVSAGSKKRY